MKQTFDLLSADCSRLTTQRYSTSFSLGIRLLGKELHAPIYAIYGFVRLADEIVDSFHDYPKKVLLERFSRDCYDAIRDGISVNPILNAFQQVVRDYAIDESLIRQFLRSMEMDLLEKTHDRQSYEEYILGSAEVVGLMCLCVFTGGDQARYAALKPAAMKLGAAFQKVNFLRDIGADYRILQRNYFPGIDLSQFSTADKQQIEAEIEQDFAAALSGIRKLPRSARTGVYVAYVYYSKLFDKIRAAKAEEILTSRFRLANSRKLMLLAGALLKNI